MLFAVAIYILVEAINRFRDPEPVQSTGMLIVAVAGLIINLISMRLLRSGKEQSLNLKGAYLEVWADMLGSIGVIGGAIAIRFTGLTWIDPVVAVGIGLWVLADLDTTAGQDRKSTRLNSSHYCASRRPSSS